jgi:hypothetical protein
MPKARQRLCLQARRPHKGQHLGLTPGNLDLGWMSELLWGGPSALGLWGFAGELGWPGCAAGG